MDINQIRSFAEVAATGSFSEAAERLYTSQSSISKHILSLEKELNVRLFDRSNRKVRLTEAGTLVLADATKILSDYDHMLVSVANHARQLNEFLAIASIPVMAQYNITGMIADFQTLYPHIRLEIHEMEGSDITENLKNQEFHLAFMRTETIDKQFDSIPIFEDKLAVILSSMHPFADRAELSLSDLGEENFLLLGRRTLLYDKIIHSCQLCGFVPHVAYTGTRMENILELVGKNQGISLMMQHAVSYIHNDHIRVIPLKEDIRSTIALIKMRQTTLPHSAQVFWNFIKSYDSQILSIQSAASPG